MGMIGIMKKTGAQVDLSRIEQPRLFIHSGDCVCKLCGEPLIIRGGNRQRVHFAHYSACRSQYLPAHPETAEHNLSKGGLVQILRKELGEFTRAKIELEVPIPEIRRVADVLVSFPMGWRVAHEIQLAVITPSELEERTNDYLCAGVDVFWWLGGRADGEVTRAWCERKFGARYSIEICNPEKGLLSEDVPLRFKVQAGTGQESNWVKGTRGNSSIWWWDLHKYWALVRFFQIWRSGDTETILRGFASTSRGRASLHGLLGKLSTKGAICREIRGNWVLGSGRMGKRYSHWSLKSSEYARKAAKKWRDDETGQK